MNVATTEIGIANEIARVGRQLRRNKNMIAIARIPPTIRLATAQEVILDIGSPISITM